MSRLYHLILPLILAPLILVSALNTALAAPQALGLVATNGNVDLKCGPQGCQADFTTFCLQQDRKSPDRGTPYHVGSGEFQVAGYTRSGEQIDLPVDQNVTLESRRKHMALRVYIPESTLKKHDLVRVAVNVKDNVVLLPRTEPGDANAHTAQEVAMLSSSMRQIGSSYIDSDSDRTAAARLLNDVINGLPERGKADNQTRERLWNEAVERAGPGAPEQGLQRAKGIFRLCKWTAGRGTPNMRNCLEQHHDEFIKFLNSKYWKASQPIY